MIAAQPKERTTAAAHAFPRLNAWGRGSTPHTHTHTHMLAHCVVALIVCRLLSSAQNQSQQKAITHQARDLFTILNYLSLRFKCPQCTHTHTKAQKGCQYSYLLRTQPL